MMHICREKFTEPLGKSVTDAIFYNHLVQFSVYFSSHPPWKVSIFLRIFIHLPHLGKSKRNFHGKWKSLLWVPALRYWSTLTHRALCWVDSDFHTWCIMNFDQVEREAAKKERRIKSQPTLGNKSRHISLGAMPTTKEKMKRSTMKSHCKIYSIIIMRGKAKCMIHCACFAPLLSGILSQFLECLCRRCRCCLFVRPKIYVC